MEIDWQNVTFSYEDEINNMTSYEPNLLVQPAKRSRQEMEKEILTIIPADESILFINHNEFLEDDDEDVKFLQQNKQIKIESSTAIYYCQTCSIDFPTIAYFERHQKTKKHQRALRMEQQGKKFYQKRSYVRKYGVKPVNLGIEEAWIIKQEKEEVQIKPEFMTSNIQFQNITDLTSEEVTLLHSIDDQIIKIDSENTAKDFYENFDIDLDLGNVEAVAKIEKLLSTEKIMEDLISSSESFTVKRESENHQQSQPEVQQPTTPQKLEKILENTSQPQPKSKIQCPMCPKSFNLRCHFTQHMNIVHSENRNFKCPICGKKYQTQELLEQHIEKHSGEKPFKCTQCDKSYNNKIDLKRHAKTHDEVLDHICQRCGWGFVRADHLEKHMKMHQKRKQQVDVIGN